MAYRLLAGSCDNGPCPTFYVDDATEDVKVQGYLTDAPAPLPTGEAVVHIPADAWQRLLSGLPIGMLVDAILGRVFRRRPTTSTTQPQHR